MNKALNNTGETFSCCSCSCGCQNNTCSCMICNRCRNRCCIRCCNRCCNNCCCPVTGRFCFLKTDIEDVPLPGAVFALRILKTQTDFYISQGDSNGLVCFDNVLPGIYELVETQAPSGFIPTAIAYVVAVSNKGIVTVNSKPAEEFGPLVNLPVVLPSGEFAFFKSDGTNPIIGAVFTLFTQPGNEPFTTGTSDESGLVLFANIPPGTYTMSETSVPPPYIPVADIFNVIVAVDGSVTINGISAQEFAAVPVINGLPQIAVDLTFIKMFQLEENPNFSGPIGGILFELTLASGGSFGTAVSANDGVFGFENVPPGQYILTELELPPNFVVDLPAPIAILENGEIFYNGAPYDPLNPPVLINIVLSVS